MKNFRNHIKVLSALSAAASDTREDTLLSIIIQTLFVKGSIHKKDLTQCIQDEFDFEPYEPEIFPLVERLLEEGKVRISNSMISLTDDETEVYKTQNIKLGDEDKERFQNFKNFIIENIDENLSINNIKLLWSVFLEYLYNSFYEYGYDAIKTLHPHIKNGQDNNGTYEDQLQISIQNLAKKEVALGNIFKQIVEGFPDFASEKDLDFLNSLAQKTLSFSSLGLKPELAIETIDHNLVDWVLYFDTNVLYSLLGLHSHPENQACHALVKLIQSNKDYINIKLRYSEQTYKELGSKRDDFKYLDDKLTDSAIRALLSSDKLDDFSKKFYSDLLNDRDGTIHPSKIIELSQRTLRQEVVEISRTAKRLENIGDEYIEKRINDYARFIADKNNIKQTFCEEKKIKFHPHYRSDRQLWHDISLREILLDSRNIKLGQEPTLNNIKYFAVTLDDLLIAYDRIQIKDFGDKNSFPVFFKPSFLLNKLIKILPIKTVDYKKAFLKAVTTKGYNRNPKKSEDILKIVNYLKSKGIDDEKVIYNLITEDLFLEKFRQHSDQSGDELNEFMESELNREFKERQKELELAKEELSSSKQKASAVESKNKLLDSKKEVLESDIRLYKKALEKLSIKVKKLEKGTGSNTQIGINFSEEEQRRKAEIATDEANSYKTELRNNILNQIELFRSKDLKKWQRRVWWNLLWVIPLITLGCFLIIPNDFLQIVIIDKNDESNEKLNIVLGIIAFLINYFFIKLIYDRYFSELSKKTRKDNIIIPRDLLRKLDDLK